MNKLFFYVSMILVIDMHGMEVSKDVAKQIIYFKEFFTELHDDVKNILNKDSAELTDYQYKSLLSCKDELLSGGQKSIVTSKASEERWLFYRLLHYLYPLHMNNRASGINFYTSGYVFLHDWPSNNYINNYYTLRSNKQFNSLLCAVIYSPSELNAELAYFDDKHQFFKPLLTIEKATYKVHLMPTEKTLLHTVHALFKLFAENPKINDTYKIKDIIASVKVQLNLEKNKFGAIMPIIVIYLPNIFIGEVTDTFKKEFEKNYSTFIDYKKAKERTELLLTYLIYFFKQHPECQGSGIVPRFNAKVTDMIFVAQGNGDNKHYDPIKYLFTDNQIYLTPKEDEHFEININSVLEQAKTFKTPATDYLSKSQELQTKKELSPFEKSFNNVPLTEEEKESFDDWKRYPRHYKFRVNDQLFFNCDDDASNSVAFFGWILNKYTKNHNISCSNFNIFINYGYWYIDTKENPKLFFVEHDRQDLYIQVAQSGLIFKGLQGIYIYKKSTNQLLTGLDILKELEQKLDQKLINTIKILSFEQSVYKIHLMPNTETVLLTLYRLFELFSTNPIINKQGARLNDYINNVKIKSDPFKEDEHATMPVIVIYVANFFPPKSKSNLDKDLLDNFAEYVNYKKSKQCTQDLLAYLVYFFNQHPECQGSGKVPRFNAKVTDMIFFAQGNGGDKHHEKYFEEDKVYFKSNQGQDFKINIQQVLEQAGNLKNPSAFYPSPKNETPNATQSKDGVTDVTTQTQSRLSLKPSNKENPQKKPTTLAQSSESAPNLLPEEEPSLGIFAQISNWFKSLFYTFFQILNF